MYVKGHVAERARAPEPSMDEILASIREIIAEDPLATRHARSGVAKSAPEAAAANAPEDNEGATAPRRNVNRAPTRSAGPTEKDPILDELLADEAPMPDPALHTAIAPPPAEVRSAETALDALAAGLAAMTAAPAAAHDVQPAVTQPESETAPGISIIVAADNEPSAAGVSSPPLAEPAQASKAAAVVGTPPPLQETQPQSFEDTIAAMLRPLLRAWLDANLPRMVETALKGELGAINLEAASPQSGRVLPN